MKKNVGFIYFYKDLNKLFKAEYEFNCAVLRSYLKNKDIDINQYINKELPNLIEIVDDILCYGNDILIFYIDKYNFDFTKNICNEISKEDSDIKIILLYNDLNIKRVKYENEVKYEIISTSEILKVINEIICIEDINYVDKEPMNIYKKNIVPVHKSNLVGVYLDKKLPIVKQLFNEKIEYILEELKYINNQLKENTYVKLLTDDISEFSEKDVFLVALADLKLKYNIYTKINIKNLTKELLLNLIGANIKIFEIDIDNDEAATELENFFENNKEYIIENNIKLSFNLYLDLLNEENIANIIEKLNELKIIKLDTTNVFYETNKKLGRKMKNILNDKEFNRDIRAFINGLKAYYTGIYDFSISGNTKHIAMDLSDINEETLSLLKEYNDGNSAIYCLKNNESLCDNDIYGYVKNISNKTGFLFSNLIEFKNTEKNNEYDIRINDSDEEVKIRIHEYNSFDKNLKKQKNTMNFNNIANKNNLDEFIKDVKAFNENGKIDFRKINDHFLIEECRWSSNKTCTLDKLPRFSLKNNNIIPCIGCKKDIGNIESLQFENIQNAHVIIEEEHIKRGCYDCDKVKNCSQCVMLPQYLSADEYCRLIKSDINISRYTKIYNILSFLKQNVKVFKDSDLSNIEVVIANKPKFKKLYEYEREKYFKDNIYIFKFDNKNVVFNPYNGKVLSLNDNTMIIAELLVEGLKLEDIKNILIKDYELDENTSSYAVENAIKIFVEKGCSNRVI